jgi:uncharacterized protein YbcI
MNMPATFPAWTNPSPESLASPPRCFDGRLARQVAQAIGGFEHRLLGRAPTSVTVVAAEDWLVMSVSETLSPIERRLARDAAGRARLQEHHRSLFEATLDALCDHVRQMTGVRLTGGLAHVDAASGSLLKTFTTRATIELFLLGEGLPGLGVPVNAHLHAYGSDGNGPVCH